MQELELVTLSEGARCNLISASVEEPSKETNVYLIGKRWGKRLMVFTSSSVQTSVRQPTKVFPGNYSALERLKKLERAWNPENSPFKKGYVGGAHSHLINTAFNKLSAEDIDYIQREKIRLEKENWIEILIGLREIRYLRDREIGEEISKKGKKVVTRVCDDEFHAYHFVFSAYNLNSKGKIKQVNLRVNNRKF